MNNENFSNVIKPAFKPAKRLFIFSFALILTACTTISDRTESIKRKADQKGMIEAKYQASPFLLTGWQRLTAPGKPIHIYIEGDGFAWLSKSEPSRNPTPKAPTGFYLASADPASNVIYLARPCQHTPLRAKGNDGCADPRYWLGHRFSPVIVKSYMNVLDQIKAETNTSGVHLIGFSGGANIAGLLAARRDDVMSLRTVAGNVDNDFFTQKHNVSPMPHSLNMANEADTLVSLPQIHFIASEDKIITPSIYESYKKRTSGSFCIRHQIIDGATHQEGWEERWPELLTQEPNCESAF